MNPGAGWAVVQGGEIKVETVSPMRRAAIVNWLATDIGLILRDAVDDAAIDMLWKIQSVRRRATLQRVIITASPETPQEGPGGR